MNFLVTFGGQQALNDGNYRKKIEILVGVEMIISKTPFRVSFFGGGTDYPDWYLQEGGLVLSSTINKYCYITVRELPNFFDYNYRLRYFKTEEVNTINEIQHPSIRETAKFLEIKKQFELVHFAEMPAQSGLGSSSTFTVGLLHALHALNNNMVGRNQLMHEAIHVEQNLIKENVSGEIYVVGNTGLDNISKEGDLLVNSLVFYYSIIVIIII